MKLIRIPFVTEDSLKSCPVDRYALESLGVVLTDEDIELSYGEKGRANTLNEIITIINSKSH